MDERGTNGLRARRDEALRRGGAPSAAADLAQELSSPVAACELLSDQETADLLALFRKARQSEATALVAAVDGMVGVLPRPFRAITKRIMFGDITNL